jgi:hypothetical protein
MICASFNLALEIYLDRIKRIILHICLYTIVVRRLPFITRPAFGFLLHHGAVSEGSIQICALVLL